MYSTLYRYLVMNQQVILPGIGMILLHRHPSQYNVAEKTFSAPSFSFELRNTNDLPAKNFYEWLSLERRISEWDAVRLINEFSLDLKRELNDRTEVNWQPVGVFKRDVAGNIHLVGNTITPGNEAPLHAEKVIRDKPLHTMRVGEREKTSSEMEVMLTGPDRKRKAEVVMLRHDRPPKKRDIAFTIAIILTFLAVIFVCIYFSQKGLKVDSTSNQSKVNVIAPSE